MKMNDLKTKTLEELHLTLLNLAKEQFNLKLQLTTGKLQQSHLIKKVRCNIARVKTVLGQKGK